VTPPRRTPTSTTTRPTTTPPVTTTTTTTRTPSTTTTTTTTTRTTTTTTPGSPEFNYQVNNVNNCGNLCREVTATLSNTGTATAEDAVADVSVLVDGDEIWETTIEVGTLEPGEGYQTTERVELNIYDAGKIEANDGYVTIRVVINYDGGSVTITDRIQVN